MLQLKYNFENKQKGDTASVEKIQRCDGGTFQEAIEFRNKDISKNRTAHDFMVLMKTQLM